VGSRFAGLIVSVQFVLFAVHAFVYETWTLSRPGPDPQVALAVKLTMAALSVSFVAASLLAFRSFSFWVRLFYKFAAGWLGFLNQFLWASILCWLAYTLMRLLDLRAGLAVVANVLFGLALVASVYGVLNAQLVRVRRIRVKLANLPDSWRGRVGALVSDVHLGHVNGAAFLRRIVARLTRLRPDIVFVSGDLYDGTRVNHAALAAPWQQIAPRFGTYFVTGNHEEFGDPAAYLQALGQFGVRVLNNGRVTLDGLQIVGVNYRDSVHPGRFRSVLQHTNLDRSRASILLNHEPRLLEIAESEGVSLQLSGHTHAGQIFPFTWLVRRIFGSFAYGLSRFGTLTVYTSSGAGTWGPPMRIGSRPEIALIEFE
jgi:predicted MPP superfamily phosphohydrolase